jgi:hypothetical protein
MIEKRDFESSLRMLGETESEAIQRRIRKGAENSVKKLENAPFAVRQLANMRLGTAKAFAIPAGDSKNQLTDTRDQPKKKPIPWQKKLIAIAIVCFVLIWYIHLVRDHMAEEPD